MHSLSPLFNIILTATTGYKDNTHTSQCYFYILAMKDRKTKFHKISNDTIYSVPEQVHRQFQLCVWYPVLAVRQVLAWSHAKCQSAGTGRCSPSYGPHCLRSEPGSGWSLQPHQLPSSLGGNNDAIQLHT